MKNKMKNNKGLLAKSVTNPGDKLKKVENEMNSDLLLKSYKSESQLKLNTSMGLVNLKSLSSSLNHHQNFKLENYDYLLKSDFV